MGAVYHNGTTPLTERGLAIGVAALTKRDPDLARIVARCGPPPLWPRAAGFATLIHIILEQQVSLAAAQAAFERLGAAGPVTPEYFLRLDDGALKRIGFSRQKTAYGRGLAQALVSGDLDVEGLERLDDEAARASLLRLKGIGPWTADIYLLMALRRPDVWPHGDLALAVAVQKIKRLSTRPTYIELSQMAEGWKPWRAVAARLCWHYYLNQKN